MDKIFENWNSFLIESDINSESQFLAEVKRRLELLKEENADDKMFSLEDLLKIPPEEIRKTYQELKTKEAKADKETRIQTLKALDPEGNLDNVPQKNLSTPEEGVWIPNEKAPSGFLGNFINSVKGYINSVFGTKLNVITAPKQKLSALGEKIKEKFVSEFSLLEREIIRAIFLFTGQSVPTVRDPEGFSETQAKLIRYVNDGIRDDFLPTKATYKKAKHILEALQQIEARSDTNYYRGLAVPLTSSQYEGLVDYEVGATINVGNIVSFSVELGPAVRFAEMTFTKARKGRLSWKGFPVIYIIPKGKMKRGVDVDEFSEYEGSEKEVISSGKFKIIKLVYCESDPNSDTLRELSRPYKDFESLSSAIEREVEKEWERPFKFRYGDAGDYYVVVFLEQL